MAERSPKPLELGFSKTVGVAQAHAERRSLALGNVGGWPRLAVATHGRVEDDWQEPTRGRPRPEALTTPTTFAWRP